MTKVKEFEYTPLGNCDSLPVDEQINNWSKAHSSIKIKDVKYHVNDDDDLTSYYALVIYETEG